MSAGCIFAGCTVAETGICALENPPQSCPKRIALMSSPASEASEGSADELEIGGSVLDAPDGPRGFPSSTTLDLDAVSDLMGRRSVTLVGILGEPESGKTAALASLYLLAANAKLKGWSFANSQSLMGFEDIARGSREWNVGSPPEQMTSHTHLSDDRRPGFLHLRLRRGSDGRVIDLALPDLPGEWTQALVRKDVWARLNFLRSADVIWIFADGRALADPENRQALLLRLGQLAGRLHAHLDHAIAPLKLVLTHRDSAQVSAETADELRQKFADYGHQIEVVEVASFARRNARIRPGHGLTELINSSVLTPAKPIAFWPSNTPGAGDRAYLSYRRDK